MCGSGLDPPGEHASCSDGFGLYFWKWLTDVEQCGVVTGQLGNQVVVAQGLALGHSSVLECQMEVPMACTS